MWKNKILLSPPKAKTTMPQIILLSHSEKEFNTCPKTECRTMEQNIEHRNKHTTIST